MSDNSKIVFSGRDPLADCLLDIRDRFQKDKFGAAEIAAGAVPASRAKPGLTEVMADLSTKHGADVLSASLDAILEELEEQRADKPGIYLVSVDTGRVVTPIKAEDVVELPPHEGEDGKLHPSMPIIHPKVSTAIALKAQESARVARVRLLASDPARARAYDHLINPDGIVDAAKGLLTSQGVKVLDSAPGEVIEVVFGRENAGSLQSMNERFHRSNMYASILAQKVLKILDGSKSCFVGPIRMDKSSKEKWFAVDVSVSVMAG